MNLRGIVLNLKSWVCVGEKSRELFDLRNVEIYVSRDVGQYIELSSEDWKLLSGAPAGSDVAVDLFGRLISILVTNDKMLLNPFQTWLTFDESKKPSKVFPQKLEVRAELQGMGLATRMMALSASKAMALGFQSVEVDAVQNVQSSTSMAHNGAYTAARLGFDGPLSDSAIQKLPPNLQGCRTLLDLFETSAGQEFWRANPESMRMKFDLKSGSRSWAALRRYMSTKKIRVIE